MCVSQSLGRWRWEKEKNTYHVCKRRRESNLPYMYKTKLSNQNFQKAIFSKAIFSANTSTKKVSITKCYRYPCI